MMRMSLTLWCTGNKLVPVVSAASTLLQKVFSPTIQPPDLASLAAETAVVVPQLNVSQTVNILELFSRYNIRYEPLVLACMWKVFKADLPVPSNKDEQMPDEKFAVCTSKAFLIMCQKGFVHDSQLLAIAMGRCVECASYLPFSGIVDVYEGIRLFDRKFFSLAEVALYAEKSPVSQLDEGCEDSPFLYSSQPNFVDVLCTELETCLQSIVDTKRDTPSPDGMVRLLHSLSVVGVMNASTLSALQKMIGPMTLRPDVVMSLLMSVHEIHVRVIDVLDHRGDDEWMRTGRSGLVCVLTSKLMELNVFAASRRCEPQLVLSFRRLFEKYPTLAEDAPKLWDAVRAIRVSHKHAVCQTEKARRPGGALFDDAYAVRVKPIMSDASEAEKYIPPQFKTWRGPALRSQRHKGPASPRRIPFGTRRVSKNYIKEKRKKFAPAVWR